MNDRTTVNARTRRLCMVLRRLRVERGLNKTEAARLIGIDPSTLSRAESEKRGISRDDLAALLAVYRAGRTLRDALLKLHQDAQIPDLLDRGEPTLHEDLQKWIGFEQDATRIRNYEPLLIPGLLQTFPYARALFEVLDPRMDDHEIGHRVAARIARQSLLRQSGAPELEVILHEAALRQRVGGPKIMGQQLGYLMEIAARPLITIRVVPANVGAHPGMNGPFVIMDYQELPSLVHLENKVASIYLDEESDVETYKLAYDGLLALAYSPERSLELIGGVASGMA